jgi:2-polyprenyl-6-methoxyphenol hydroxylase-like FAD-dependent oxidoreductase
MAGLFAGLLLRRHGWSVDVFERSDVELSGRGAGIVSHPELIEALATVGLDPGADFGVQIARRRTFDSAGRIVGELECPQTATSWNRLFEMLRQAYPAESYHLGREVRRIDQHGERVVARFADGSSAEGDLLIGADGFRSTVRGQFLPDVQPVYAGYVAWRGLVEESLLSPQTHAGLFETFAFCLPPREQMLGYPVAGPDNDLRVGRRRYNFVWYRPANENTELPHLLTDESGHTHSLSIAPPLIARRVIQDMREASERVLAPQFQEIVRVTGQPFLQPIYDLETPRMAFGRVALIGDAAFVARPHVGAGVTKATHDAMALLQALEDEHDAEAALRRFESARIGVGRRIVERARHLGAYVRSTFRDEEEQQLAERHRTPEAVMGETALLDFLHDDSSGRG